MVTQISTQKYNVVHFTDWWWCWEKLKVKCKIHFCFFFYPIYYLHPSYMPPSFVVNQIRGQSIGFFLPPHYGRHVRCSFTAILIQHFLPSLALRVEFGLPTPHNNRLSRQLVVSWCHYNITKISIYIRRLEPSTINLTGVVVTWWTTGATWNAVSSAGNQSNTIYIRQTRPILVAIQMHAWKREKQDDTIMDKKKKTR